MARCTQSPGDAAHFGIDQPSLEGTLFMSLTYPIPPAPFVLSAQRSEQLIAALLHPGVHSSDTSGTHESGRSVSQQSPKHSC